MNRALQETNSLLSTRVLYVSHSNVINTIFISHKENPVNTNDRYMLEETKSMLPSAFM